MSNVRVHPQSGESVSNRVTSFDIRLSDFVIFFNNDDYEEDHEVDLD